jgi:hypothetical protein
MHAETLMCRTCVTTLQRHIIISTGTRVREGKSLAVSFATLEEKETLPWLTASGCFSCLALQAHNLSLHGYIWMLIASITGSQWSNGRCPSMDRALLKSARDVSNEHVRSSPGRCHFSASL